jgi:MoaA/NifB/PqqE/SkfB family radical SAM enzyme
MLNIIDVSPTNECNYSCSYCIAGAYKSITESACKNPMSTVKSGSQLHPDVLIGWVRSHFSPEDTIVSFAGGEPLLYPGLKHCLMSMAEYRKVVVTNAMLLPCFLEKIFPRMFEYNVRVKASFHPSMTRWEDFRKRLSLIPPTHGLVNLVLYPQFLLTGIHEEYIANIRESGYAWNVNAFKGKWEGEEWSKDREEVKGIITWDTPHKPFRLLTIEPNGNIYQCYKHKLGNIYSGEDIDIRPDPPKCVEALSSDGVEHSVCDCMNAIVKLHGGWEKMGIK